MKSSKFTRLITCICYVIYIGSIMFFIKEKEFTNIFISIACMILTFILQIINKKSNKFINDQLYIAIIAFVLTSSLLGSCYGFYNINYYDDFLHIWSGFIACSFGFTVINILNTPRQIKDMNKIFIIIFLVMFGMGVGGFWELSEFFLDLFLGMNTQAGGLTDTMIDMVDGLIGTIIMIPFIMKKVNNIKKSPKFLF